jgi:CheY-like chemotaxis protein
MMTQTNDSWDVVLAEDDMDDVMIFELAIKETRIAISLRHAADGDELFKILKEALPDIIFLDINMPCKDGVTCIVEIRKNPAYNHIPVIMYTSYYYNEKVDKTYEEGANFYLVKTNSVRDLAEHLKRIFSIEWKKYMYFPPKTQFILGQ